MAYSQWQTIITSGKRFKLGCKRFEPSGKRFVSKLYTFARIVK